MGYFSELDITKLFGKRIILDVDGTLVFDGQNHINEKTKIKINNLKKQADIYLCSNGITERTNQLAKYLGVSFINSHYNKPNKKVMSDLPDTNQDTVVIGDKYLTDGLMAKSINAHFVKVRRLCSGKEKVVTKIVNYIDDICYQLLPAIWLCRPSQWIKNLLVFAPVFFIGKQSTIQEFYSSVIAFFIFTLAASTVYIFNDIKDIEEDKNHPKKQYRPIASSQVSVKKATLLFVSLLSLLIVALCFNQELSSIIALYIGLNLLYTHSLKRIPVVDILLVSFFYLLRIVAGGLITGIPLSSWILMCTFFSTLFVISGKRRAEYRLDSKRSVLKSYSPKLLDCMIFSTAIITIVSYGLYSVSTQHSSYLFYSSVFVIITITRVLNDIYHKPELAETPESLIFRDKWVLASFITWFIYVFILYYIY